MKSPFTGSEVIGDNYSEWEIVLDFAPQRRGSTSHRQFVAWLDSLQGARGTFTYSPFGASKPVIVALKTVGFAYSTEINLTGFNPSSATTITPGDYFSIAGKLHRVTVAPSVADGQGDATISFTPALRADRAAGSTVNFLNPTGTFRLAGDDDASGSTVLIDVNAAYCQSVTAREVL